MLSQILPPISSIPGDKANKRCCLLNTPTCPLIDRPFTGCNHAGAISAIGCMTKARSKIRGCGSIGLSRLLPSQTTWPYANRSRSKVLAPHLPERTRPKQLSTLKSSLSRRAGVSPVSSARTALIYQSWLELGTGALTYQPDRLLNVTARCASCKSAAWHVASELIDCPPARRLAPRPTRISSSSITTPFLLVNHALNTK